MKQTTIKCSYSPDGQLIRTQEISPSDVPLFRRLSTWVVVLLIILVFLAGSICRADYAIPVSGTMVLNQGPYSYDVGGEFTINYNNGAESQSSFCLQTAYDIYPGQTYNYTIGSVSGVGNPVVLGVGLVYSEFLAGTLPNYAYTGASRWSDAGALQAYIWTAEDQTLPNNWVAATPNNNLYYAYALSVLGASINNPDNGAYNVYDLQVTQNGEDVQNQLVEVSLPEPSQWAAMAFVLTIGGVVWVSRQHMKARLS